MTDALTSLIVDDTQDSLKENQFNSDAKAYRRLIESAKYSPTSPGESFDSQAVQKEMEKRGILPDLCIGYLKQNFLKLDKNSDGKVTKDELETEEAETTGLGRNASLVANDKESEINHMLLREVRRTDKLFEKIANSRTEGGSREGIEMEDLLAQSKERLRSAFMRESKLLLDEGAQSWMAYLDEKDGQYDGYASAQDIATKLFDAYAVPQSPISTAAAGVMALSERVSGPPNTLGRSLRALASGDTKEAIEVTRFLKDLAAGRKHQDLLRDGALDVIDIMRRSGVKPVVVSSKYDYASMSKELDQSPKRTLGN